MKNKNIISYVYKHTTEYANHISSIIFTVGCPFRCPYCSELLVEDGVGLDIDEVIADLSEDKLIDNIIISGGEPLIHGDSLVYLINQIRTQLGLSVKLDTTLLPLSMYTKHIIDIIDCVSVDIKANPFSYVKYKNLLGFFPFDNTDFIDNITYAILNAKEIHFRLMLHPGVFKADELVDTLKSIDVLCNVKKGWAKIFLYKYYRIEKQIGFMDIEAVYSHEDFEKIQNALKGLKNVNRYYIGRNYTPIVDVGNLMLQNEYTSKAIWLE